MIHKKKGFRDFKESQIIIHLLINPMPTPQDVVGCESPVFEFLHVLYYPSVRWFGI